VVKKEERKSAVYKTLTQKVGREVDRNQLQREPEKASKRMRSSASVTETSNGSTPQKGVGIFLKNQNGPIKGGFNLN